MSSNFVTNPETGRTIRIGGRPWLKLVKKGVLDKGDYLPPDCAARIEKGASPFKSPGLTPLDPQGNEEGGDRDIKFGAEQTSNAALDIIDQIQNGDIDIPTDMSRDEARDYLQKLIFTQMLKKKKKFKNTRLEQLGKKARPLRTPKPPVRTVRRVPRKPVLRRQRAITPVYTRPPKKKEPVYFNDEEEEYEYEYVEEQSAEPIFAQSEISEEEYVNEEEYYEE